MTLKSKQNTFRLLISLFLIASVLFSSTGYLDKVLGFCGLDILSESNDRYLQSSFQRSLKFFGILSVLKIGLAVVGETEVGVGFGIQVGKVVQVAYDYINIAWKTVLIGVVVLLGTQYMLQVVDLADQWFLTAALGIFFLMLLTKWLLPRRTQLQRSLRDIGLLAIVFTVSLYIIVPLSVAGGAVLSQYITQPSLLEAESKISHMREELFPEDKTHNRGILAKLSTTKEQIKNTLSYLKDRTRELMVMIFKLIAVYIFDCVVFPLTFLISLLWFAKLTAKYLFSLRREQVFKEDLAEMIARHHATHVPSKPDSGSLDTQQS